MTVEDLKFFLGKYDDYLEIKFVLPDLDGPIEINKVEYKEPINNLPGFIALSE